MKKLLLLAGVILLTSCTKTSTASVDELNSNSDLQFFRGVIVEIKGNTAKIEPNSNQSHILHDRDEFDTVVVEANLKVSDDEFVVDDEVVVYYSGEVSGKDVLSIDEVDIISIDEFNANKDKIEE